MALTAKQQRFAEEYVVDLNATQAAIRAGYSKKSAKSIGQENLTKPDVAAAIQTVLAERSKRTEITADAVIAELAKLGFADMADYAEWGPDKVKFVDSKDLDPSQTAAVSEVSSVTTTRTSKDGEQFVTVNSKFKLHDKRAALELLGRHLGAIKNLHEHSGPGGGPIPHDVTHRFSGMSEDEMDEALRNYYAGVAAGRAIEAGAGSGNGNGQRARKRVPA